MKLFVFQITDKNDLQFLNSWHDLNKPHVLLFDQVPAVPLLYKVGSCLVVFHVKYTPGATDFLTAMLKQDINNVSLHLRS